MDPIDEQMKKLGYDVDPTKQKEFSCRSIEFPRVYKEQDELVFAQVERYAPKLLAIAKAIYQKTEWVASKDQTYPHTLKITFLATSDQSELISLLRLAFNEGFICCDELRARQKI